MTAISAPMPVDVLLADGSTAQIRHIDPSDAPLVAALYGRVSRETLYYRYFSAREVSPKELERLVNPDPFEVGVLVTVLHDQVIAIAQYSPGPG